MERSRLRLWVVSLAFILLGFVLILIYQTVRAGEISLAEGRRLYEAGRFELAEPAFRRATLANPHKAEAWYGLGMCLKNQGQADEAAEALSKATALRDDFAPWWIECAEALQWAGRHDQAIEAWRRAASLLPPKDARVRIARMNIARSLASQGQTDEAVELLEEMLAEKEDREVRFTLAEVLAWKGRFEESAEQYRRSLDTQPEN